MAESFGVDAERYDRARPRYPDAMVDAIVAGCPGHTLLDVGCGTGIAARQFRAAGCTVLGVEPDARMAEFARRSGIEVEVATFESWEAGDRRFDGLIAGQAWHWVDPAAGAAKAASVLRPGGRLALFWNAEQPPPEIWDRLPAIYERVTGHPPFGFQTGGDGQPKPVLARMQETLTRVADGIDGTGAFDSPEQWQFPSERTCTRDEWLDALPTSGALTQLPPDQVAQILAGVGSTIDAVGGSFTIQCTTVVVTATRTG